LGGLFILGGYVNCQPQQHSEDRQVFQHNGANVSHQPLDNPHFRNTITISRDRMANILNTNCRDVYDDPFGSYRPWQRFLWGVFLYVTGFGLSAWGGEEVVYDRATWRHWILLAVGTVLCCLGLAQMLLGHAWPPKQECSENSNYRQPFQHDGENVAQKQMDFPPTSMKGSKLWIEGGGEESNGAAGLLRGLGPYGSSQFRFSTTSRGSQWHEI
jgi:hypothetical protein